jgi:hypothetical protein
MLCLEPCFEEIMTFSPIRSSGTIFHVSFVQKVTLFNSVLKHIHTHTHARSRTHAHTHTHKHTHTHTQKTGTLDTTIPDSRTVCERFCPLLLLTLGTESCSSCRMTTNHSCIFLHRFVHVKFCPLHCFGLCHII